jgi:prolipoprotein diacylglyceryltransferase
MLLFINISTKYGGYYYDLFYFLAILFSMFTLIIAGKRRNYPMISWMLSILMILLFLILGTKIFTISPGQWTELFQHGKMPVNTGRTILGGIAGCMIGLFISRVLFGFGNDMFDILSYVFPVAMAIQRVGCLLAGCCFGTPTNVPWAIIYPRNTCAHFAHVNRGLIDYFAPFSLPVHPNQLYQILACIIIVLLLYLLFRKRIHKPGNLFLISITLYLISRIITEFWRDESSNGYAGNTVSGLKIIQWILTGVVAVMGIIILVREKTGKYRTFHYHVRNSEKRNALFFLLLFLMILSIWNWLPGIERLHVLSVSLALGVISLIHGFRKLKGGRWQWSMILLIPLVLCMISWMNDDIPGTDKNKKDFYSIGTGYMGGKYFFGYCPSGDCCNGPTYHCKADYEVYGLGFSYTHFSSKGNKIINGMNLSYGNLIETDWENRGHPRNPYIFGLNYKFLYDCKYAGIGLGFHAGLFYHEENTYSLFPQLELRAGTPEYFYISGKIGDQFPGVTGLPFALEIGTGFGTDKFALKAGYYLEGYYVKPAMNLFNDRLTLEGYFTFLPVLYNSDSYNDYAWPDEKLDRYGFSIWYNFH